MRMFIALQVFECFSQVGLFACHCIRAVLSFCDTFRSRSLHAPGVAFAVECARVMYSAGDPVVSYHK